MATTPILLTRPLADSKRLAATLALPCVISPLLEIVPAGPVPDAQAVIFTSSNGVAAWIDGGGRTGLPAWCVGPRTAARAAEAGFDIRATAETADALAAIIPDDAPPLLHARGAEVRGDLAGILRAKGLEVSEAVIYRADTRPLIAEAKALARSGPVIAPLYSPRSAKLLVAEWPEGFLPHLRAVALSDAVARALPVPALAVAARPNGPAMIAAIRNAITG